MTTASYSGVAEDSLPHARGAVVEWEVSDILQALRFLGTSAVTHRLTQRHISEIKCLKSLPDVF